MIRLGLIEKKHLIQQYIQSLKLPSNKSIIFLLGTSNQGIIYEVEEIKYDNKISLTY